MMSIQPNMYDWIMLCIRLGIIALHFMAVNILIILDSVFILPSAEVDKKERLPLPEFHGDPVITMLPNNHNNSMCTIQQNDKI